MRFAEDVDEACQAVADSVGLHPLGVVLRFLTKKVMICDDL